MPVKVDEIINGKVTGVTKFGAFVDLENGQKGLVHISEISNTFVENIDSVIKVGDEVKVKVVNIADDGKINLSIKKAVMPEPKPEFKPTPKPNAETEKPQLSEFEQMLSNFKKVSDEKIGSMRKAVNTRRTGRH